MIKKNLGLLLLGTALAINTIAYAVDQPDTITFRNVPWYSNPQTLCASLEEDGYITTNTITSYPDRAWHSPETITPHWNYRPVPYFGVTFIQADEKPIGKVAGYQVRYIYSYFLKGYELEPPKLLNDPYDSRMVSASYWIYGQDQENKITYSEALYDLTNKLSKLYGDYTETYDEYHIVKLRVWRAKDDSIVKLDYDPSAINSPYLPYDWSLTIKYEKCEEKYAKELYKTVLSMNNTTDDIDGL